MEMNIQNYEYLNELLKIAQNCLKVLIPAHKNLLKIAQNTCPQNLLKIAQNCLKSTYTYPKNLLKSVQNCLKNTYTCPKNLLKIAQNGSKLLKIAQKWHFEKFWGDFETFWDILRHIETY